MLENTTGEFLSFYLQKCEILYLLPEERVRMRIYYYFFFKG